MPYALWLLVPPPLGETFDRIIRATARRLDTDAFEPHVTLLTGIEAPQASVTDRAQRLTQAIAPCAIRLTTAAYTEAFYRALFICAEPDEAIRAAHAAARIAFPEAPEADFMPHLSLAYGDIPVRDKEQVLDAIGRDFGLGFTAAELALIWYQEGEPPWGWRRVGRWELVFLGG